MKVFPERADPARRYLDLEKRFLEFCTLAGVRASVVDAVMWATMRRLSRSLLEFLIDPRPAFKEPLHRSVGEARCPVVEEVAEMSLRNPAQRAGEHSVGETCVSLSRYWWSTSN